MVPFPRILEWWGMTMLPDQNICINEVTCQIWTSLIRISRWLKIYSIKCSLIIWKWNKIISQLFVWFHILNIRQKTINGGKSKPIIVSNSSSRSITLQMKKNQYRLRKISRKKYQKSFLDHCGVAQQFRRDGVVEGKGVLFMVFKLVCYDNKSMVKVLERVNERLT